MCGIAGILGCKTRSKTERIEAMLESIKYRGPDEVGVKYLMDGVLGHVRLSIIDIKGGKQPMEGPNGSTNLVFNGEIYGYNEIKKKSTDYPYTTDSDTEVILALYEEHRDYKEMLSHLPGMFAFGLWDNRTDTLFCARDRFGEKPLYYTIGADGEFIFASEIKAIIASGLINPKVDKSVLWDFLQHSYIYPTTTIYENVYVLPPAHYLTWHNGIIHVERYWSLPPVNEDISVEEAVEEFRRLFHQAVARQTIADVPVGAFLSGGLDSGSVVAQMAQIVPQVTTISFASTTGFDESPLAYTMARRYNTNHIVAKDTEVNIVDLLFKMQEIFDEPFADPAAISAYVIAKEARKHVKVILSGDAGDEVLGGYTTKYRSLYYAKQMYNSTMPLSMRKAMLNLSYISQRLIRKARFIGGADVAQTVFRGTTLADTEVRRRAVGIARNYPNDIIDYYHRNNMNMISADNLEKMGLVGPDNSRYIREGFLGKDELDNAVRCDLLEYLPGDGLLKTDRTTMAVSLESRTPFCDVDLASFCIALPFHLKVSDKTDKIILRKSMENMWTKEISHNIKTGFSPPWDKWLASEQVKELMEEYFFNTKAKIWDFLDYKGTTSFLVRAKGWPRWILLNLALWCETR